MTDIQKAIKALDKAGFEVTYVYNPKKCTGVIHLQITPVKRENISSIASALSKEIKAEIALEQSRGK